MRGMMASNIGSNCPFLPCFAMIQSITKLNPLGVCRFGGAGAPASALRWMRAILTLVFTVPTGSWSVRAASVWV